MNDPIQPSKTVFEKDLQAHLDSSTQALPGDIVSRLRQARQQALQQGRQGKPWHLSLFTQHPWMTACASVLALALVVGYNQLSVNHSPFEELDAESDILFAEDDLEMYEDLEFYRWLANTGY